ncbi:phytanoyl-CoA dioxygenase family protein [Gimesia fumaroli]|jgi:phytanoyl-CoA hydroxylase|uniref:Phytanoyl-CoA dioxygenase (PhyH) n=1 Tax=Gimesia fumaroli TaxID=2527976 RepID=A0A518I7G7_9PLAN|nr:phytanoyl-CoA dioxygenase family protein [Gimesia fumaroli]QDV49038.1 Phytanoyl-CoA dioxygenase (PhyH) [Gimesia fumaroli]
MASSSQSVTNDRLTSEEFAKFEQDGYLILRNLCPESLRQEMLATTKDGLSRVVEPVEYEADVEYPGSPPSRNVMGGETVRRLKQAHSRGMCFTDLINHPALVGRLAQLLGPDYVMPLAHHNCVMTKQPEFSSDTLWHQDIRFWSFERKELISVWVALGEENLDNGCLKVIPGTHRMEFKPDQLDERIFLRPDVPENQELIDTSVAAELHPGDVLFFHCRTFHAATRNYTNQPKFSAVFTFRPADNPPVRDSRSAALPELIVHTRQ